MIPQAAACQNGGGWTIHIQQQDHCHCIYLWYQLIHISASLHKRALGIKNKLIRREDSADNLKAEADAAARHAQELQASADAAEKAAAAQEAQISPAQQAKDEADAAVRAGNEQDAQAAREESEAAAKAKAEAEAFEAGKAAVKQAADQQAAEAKKEEDALIANQGPPPEQPGMVGDKQLVAVKVTPEELASIKSQIKEKMLATGSVTPEVAEKTADKVATSATSGSSFDFASLDPSGVYAMYKAFNQPGCEKP